MCFLCVSAIVFCLLDLLVMLSSQIGSDSPGTRWCLADTFPDKTRYIQFFLADHGQKPLALWIQDDLNICLQEIEDTVFTELCIDLKMYYLLSLH